MLERHAFTGRNQEILSSIVREYIETGEPVGSRTVSKRRKDALSPASVRNAMADLTEEGYLSQPHTSAGRMPTEKAFRFYVRSLVAGRMPTAAAQRSTWLNATPMLKFVTMLKHIKTRLLPNIVSTALLYMR
jgi:heat-inducible transcriptional repressor